MNQREKDNVCNRWAAQKDEWEMINEGADSERKMIVIKHALHLLYVSQVTGGDATSINCCHAVKRNPITVSQV